MNKFKFLVAAASFSVCTAMYALSIDDAAIKNDKCFGIQFPDGTSYYGVSGMIVSVSKQEYIAGPLLVTEISLDMLGSSSQVRIYNARALDSGTMNLAGSANLPDVIKKRYEGAANIGEKSIVGQTDKLSGKFDLPKIRKDYPTTTHSHTLEFVVDDLEELELFYSRFISDLAGASINASKTSSPSSAAKAAAIGNIPFRIAKRLYILNSVKIESSGLDYKGPAIDVKKKHSK